MPSHLTHPLHVPATNRSFHPAREPAPAHRLPRATCQRSIRPPPAAHLPRSAPADGSGEGLPRRARERRGRGTGRGGGGGTYLRRSSSRPDRRRRKTTREPFACLGAKRGEPEATLRAAAPLPREAAAAAAAAAAGDSGRQEREGPCLRRRREGSKEARKAGVGGDGGAPAASQVKLAVVVATAAAYPAQAAARRDPGAGWAQGQEVTAAAAGLGQPSAHAPHPAFPSPASSHSESAYRCRRPPSRPGTESCPARSTHGRSSPAGLDQSTRRIAGGEGAQPRHAVVARSAALPAAQRRHKSPSRRQGLRLERPRGAPNPFRPSGAPERHRGASSLDSRMVPGAAWLLFGRSRAAPQPATCEGRTRVWRSWARVGAAWSGAERSAPEVAVRSRSFAADGKGDPAVGVDAQEG
ncbi:uncharacterized protein LOC143838875 [Paroedura picta]|uniref:uncharacterized protein LOC143838875 n=1 Tax=Paroedura picta TaxID=143630 RepID=UPI00405779FD